MRRPLGSNSNKLMAEAAWPGECGGNPSRLARRNRGLGALSSAEAGLACPSRRPKSGGGARATYKRAKYESASTAAIWPWAGGRRASRRQPYQPRRKHRRLPKPATPPSAWSRLVAIRPRLGAQTRGGESSKQRAAVGDGERLNKRCMTDANRHGRRPHHMANLRLWRDVA